MVSGRTTLAADPLSSLHRWGLHAFDFFYFYHFPQMFTSSEVWEVWRAKSTTFHIPGKNNYFGGGGGNLALFFLKEPTTITVKCCMWSVTMLRLVMCQSSIFMNAIATSKQNVTQTVPLLPLACRHASCCNF